MSSINFSTAKKPLYTFSMAALTDIVLLLLIFFLLTSNFIPQFGINVNLPDADAAAPSEDQYVSVAITDDGRFYVGSREVARENLLEVIREAKGTKTTVLLRADQEATIGEFAYVGNIAKALEMRVLMATERAGLR